MTYLGWFIFTLPFCLLIAWSVRMIGWRLAMGVWSTALGFTGTITLGLWLVRKGME